MPIPNPTSNETEQDFISRCVEAIYDEYGAEQASAICYSTWRKESKLGQQEFTYSKLRELHYRGIDLTKLQEEGDGLEDSCWEDYAPLGTKILDGREVPNCIPKEDHPDYQ
jgi:hypothetical protein